MQVVLTISSVQHREKNCYFTDFFITRCQRGNCQSMWRKEQNIFCREMWSKIKICRMLQWNSCRQKPDVLSSIQGLRKLVEADYVCICFVTKHHYTELPWFSFSLFYILLFSVHIVNVNAAKSSKVFITCPWTYIYIYIYIIVFKFQVVIWESFPTCYFHSASLSLTPFLFLPKHCVLNGRSWAFPITCA